MKSLLKSMSVFIVAVILLGAGVILPDLLVNNKLNKSLDDPDYIDADNLSPYGDFYASKQMMSKLLGHYKIIKNDSAYYEFVDYAEPEFIDKYYEGYMQMLKFIKYWNNSLYVNVAEEGTTNDWFVKGSDGYTFGIVDFENELNGEGGEIVFDIESGIPVFVQLNLPYVNSIRIDSIWQRYVMTYSEFTSMEFISSVVQNADVAYEPGVADDSPVAEVGNRMIARNYDSSILLIGEMEYDENFILQFYLE